MLDLPNSLLVGKCIKWRNSSMGFHVYKDATCWRKAWLHQQKKQLCFCCEGTEIVGHVLCTISGICLLFEQHPCLCSCRKWNTKWWSTTEWRLLIKWSSPFYYALCHQLGLNLNCYETFADGAAAADTQNLWTLNPMQIEMHTMCQECSSWSLVL